MKFIPKRVYRAGFGYDSVRKATWNENRPVTSDRSSGVRHDRQDRYKQVSAARDLHRNNYLFNAVINAVLNHMVGSDEVNIQIRCKDQTFSDMAEKYIKGFINRRPETRNRFKGIQFWRAIATEILVTGESILLKTNNGQIQMIESELMGGAGLDNNDGIIFFDDNPIRYKICSYGDDGFPNPENGTEVEAQYVIHHFHNPRISSTRGIPPMQPVFDLLLYLGDIISSEAISWDIISRVALIAERRDGPMLALDESEEDDRIPGGYMEEWGDARVFHADIGESLSTLDRNVPNKNFGDTLLEFLRLAGSIFGIPGEFIVSNFSKSNYSQSKAATIFAARGIGYWQDILKNVIEDVVRWKIKSAYSVNTPPEYEVEIYLPGAIHFDPQKESTALTDKLSGGLTTMASAVGEFGFDYEDLLAERKAEIQKAINTAKEIEEESGVVVPWQLFSGLGNIAGSPRQIDAEIEREQLNNEE